MNLPITVTKTPCKTYQVEFNAVQFERLAANFGLFNPDFLKSLDRAEADIQAGRVWEIKKFSDLKRKRRPFPPVSPYGET